MNSDISSLIRLIDDPDLLVYEHVRDKLVQAGPDIIPILENTWEISEYDETFHERIENIIHSIQFDATSTALELWKNSSSRDLLEAALIIANYVDAGLEKSHVYEYLEYIERQVWVSMSNKLSSIEKVLLMNKVFFGQEGFKGNRNHFYTSANSIISDVIALREGNSLSLSLLYSVIGQRLGMPLYGVNLPGHFMVAYIRENQFSHIHQTCKNTHDVLFYISPFNNGKIIDKMEINNFLKKLNLHSELKYSAPCSNTTIIKKMLGYIEKSMDREGKKKKSEDIKKLQLVLSEDTFTE